MSRDTSAWKWKPGRKPAREWKPGEKEKWIALLDLNAGQFSSYEWSELLGVSHSYMRQWAREYGWKFAPRVLSREEMVQRIREGRAASPKWQAHLAALRARRLARLQKS